MTANQVLEETALNWLRRVQRNRRHLNQNPICFPSFSKSIDGGDEEHDSDVPFDIKIPSSSANSFVVTPCNILKLASQTWLSDFSLLNDISSRSKRWRRRIQSKNSEKNQDICFSDKDPFAALEASFLESFPNGSGLPFLDSILSRNETNDGIFLDVMGSCRIDLTQICTKLVASYAAATSLGCFGHRNAVSPPIVLLDPECSLSLTDMIATVKTEVLRRWNSTDSFRHKMKCCLTKVEGIEADTELDFPDNDYKQIEQDIQSILGRIHIIRPRDILHGCISTIESLVHLLDLQSKQFTVEMAPAMVVFVSTLDAFSSTTKLQENLPDGSGLSGCTDFMRHLSRLKSKYNMVLISTSLMSCDSWSHTKYKRNTFENFERMVTHQIIITKCPRDSVEYREGFDFVAKCSTPKEPNSIMKIPFAMKR